MKRPVFRYIVIYLLVLAIGFGIGRVQQNGMGGTLEGISNWWSSVCERFESMTSKEEASEPTVDATEPSNEESDATVPAETAPEKQPPVNGDEPLFIENADKTISMCSYEFLAMAQRNEKYDVKTACGPINIPHEDDEVYQVFFHPCEEMDTLKHNHDGQKVNMMINLNKVSVFCCEDKNAGHSTGVWNLNSIFCIGFDNTHVEVCKTCKGLANGDKIIGEVLEMELTEEDWNEIQKVACYWWETDEESGELVRVFGLKTCTCDNPNPGKPDTPNKPGPGKPGPSEPDGGDEDPTNPTEPDPSEPTEPSKPTEPTEPEDKPEYNPTIPPVPDDDFMPDDEPVVEIPEPDSGEPAPEYNPGIPPVSADDFMPDDEPVVHIPAPDEAPVEIPAPADDRNDDVVFMPDEEPVVDIPPVVNIPTAPVVETPVVEIPAPVVETPAVEIPAPVVEAPVVEIPAPVVEAPAVEIPAPVVEAPVVEIPAPVVEAPAVEIPAPVAEMPAVEAPAFMPDEAPVVDIPAL